MSSVRGLKERLGTLDPPISDETFRELDDCARHLVPLYLRKKRPLRPSGVARELVAMSKSLQRAATAAEALGEDGILYLYASSNADQTPENLDPRPFIEFLTRIARWSARAAETAKEMKRSALDDRGGRNVDENLRSLVVLLMSQFHAILGIRPTSTVNPDNGLFTSPCDEFIKAAIGSYAPDGIVIEPPQIEAAIVYARPCRDLEFFEPPAI